MTYAKYLRCKRALERFVVLPAPGYFSPDEKAAYQRRREAERDRLTVCRRQLLAPAIQEPHQGPEGSMTRFLRLFAAHGDEVRT